MRSEQNKANDGARLESQVEGLTSLILTLDSQLEFLNTAISDLHDNLSPVLKEAAPDISSTPEYNVPETSATLVKELAKKVEWVAELSTRVNAIKDLLQIV